MVLIEGVFCASGLLRWSNFQQLRMEILDLRTVLKYLYYTVLVFYLFRETLLFSVHFVNHCHCCASASTRIISY